MRPASRPRRDEIQASDGAKDSASYLVTSCVGYCAANYFYFFLSLVYRQADWPIG